MTGYTSSEAANATYDAASKELRISIPAQISEGTPDLLTPFYRGFTVMSARNTAGYETERRNVVGPDGKTRTLSYYAIVTMEPAEADRIRKSFRANYTYSFNSADVLGAAWVCVSAGNSNCSFRISGGVTSVEVRNTADNKDYPQGGP
ncbi:hypothetical protein D0B54_02700 [Solimonas sp. K1W22B-7]|nr:hypothetical protein D0B54_02700 [Solimonas sp. K1W22B-7]